MLVILSIILAISPKLAAIIFTIAPIMYLIYLFKKETRFKNYNFVLLLLLTF
ncbi:hypothetical protein [Clostridium tetani]|uniref:hypothetical protein n=1 Tax=Clostridium tetani TaxID=1513 RepID=UPI000A4FC386|nr:hypothetical protein [Clostridium tetani]